MENIACSLIESIMFSIKLDIMFSIRALAKSKLGSNPSLKLEYSYANIFLYDIIYSLIITLHFLWNPTCILNRFSFLLMYWISFLDIHSNFRIASAVIDGAGYDGGKLSWSGICPGVGKHSITENTLKSIPFHVFSLVLQFHSKFHAIRIQQIYT